MKKFSDRAPLAKGAGLAAIGQHTGFYNKVFL